MATVKNNKDIGTLAAEEGLLSSILYKPDKIIEIIDELNPELFSVKEFGVIYRCIVELWKENIIPDEVTVINRAVNLGFNITPELIKKLANSNTFVAKRQLKKYCEIIKLHAFKRKTNIQLEEFLENNKNTTQSPEKFVGELLGLAIDLQDKMKAEDRTSVINIDEAKLIQRVDYKFENPNTIEGLTTGYPTLDMFTDGFRPGDIITITGQNSSGKSYFMQCIAFLQALYLYVNKIDKKVFIKSPEMTKDQLQYRGVQIVSGIEDKYLSNPRLYFINNNIEPTAENFAKFKQKISNAIKLVNQLPIIINDYSAPSAMESCNDIKKLHLKHNLACVYLDYADLFDNEGYDDYKNQYQSYKLWKRVAKDTGVPVVIVNQYLKDLKLNKADGYRGTMQNISGGKAAMNDSHLILHVYRPEVFVDYIQEHPELRGKTFIYSDKMRDRPYGSTMKDIEFQMYNGILREAKDIMNMNQKVVDGLEDFVNEKV